MFVGRVPDYFLGRPTVKGAEEYDALSAITLADLPPGPRALFVVHEFDRDPAAFADPHLYAWTDGVWSDVPDPRPLPSLPGELRASSPLADRGRDRGGPGVALAGRSGLGVVDVRRSGRGRSRRAGVRRRHAHDRGDSRLERLGVPLTGSWGPDARLRAWRASAGMGSDSSRGRRAWIRPSQIDQ